MPPIVEAQKQEDDMSLKETAQTGRNIVWTRRGIEELGGGFLGLFLLKLIGKSEERQAKKKQDDKTSTGFFDRFLSLFD